PPGEHGHALGDAGRGRGVEGRYRPAGVRREGLPRPRYLPPGGRGGRMNDVARDRLAQLGGLGQRPEELVARALAGDVAAGAARVAVAADKAAATLARLADLAAPDPGPAAKGG